MISPLASSWKVPVRRPSRMRNTDGWRKSRARSPRAIRSPISPVTRTSRPDGRAILALRSTGPAIAECWKLAAKTPRRQGNLIIKPNHKGHEGHKGKTGIEPPRTPRPPRGPEQIYELAKYQVRTREKKRLAHETPAFLEKTDCYAPSLLPGGLTYIFALMRSVRRKTILGNNASVSYTAALCPINMGLPSCAES